MKHDKPMHGSKLSSHTGVHKTGPMTEHHGHISQHLAHEKSQHAGHMAHAKEMHNKGY